MRLADRVRADPAGQRVEHHLLRLVLGDVLHAVRVHVEALGVHDHLDVGRVVELAQLERRELRVRRAAAGEDVHVGDRLRLQTGVDVGGDVGHEHLVAGLRQHAGHVERDVPDAQDGDARRLERPGLGDVRVGVVPADEVRGAVRRLLAGDAEVAVRHGTGGDDDRVVELAQVLELHVDAVLHVAEEADLRLGQHPLERLDDLLDARVVGGDAVPDQPEGRGQPLDDVDRDVRLGLGEDVGGVDAGRSAAHDGHTKSHADESADPRLLTERGCGWVVTR